MNSIDANEDVRVVLVTAPDERVGREIARKIVDSRLAACVNLVPGVTSIYRWEETIHEDQEVLLLVKTRASRCRDLEARVRDMHPYDVPEVLTLAVAGGSAPYLDWVREESSP